MKATLNFFEAMGAKIAANKSLSLGNSAGLRKKLKKMAWAGNTIPVACDARDLGSHVCLGKRQVGTTVTKRIGDTLVRGKQLVKMHLKQQHIEHVLTAAVMSKALYATEAVPVAARSMQRLRTVTANNVVKGVKGGAVGRVPSLALAMADKEVDPYILLLSRRVMAMRRMLVRAGYDEYD